MLTISLMVALGLTGTHPAAADERAPRLNGVWNVNVATRNCETGDLVRIDPLLERDRGTRAVGTARDKMALTRASRS